MGIHIPEHAVLAGVSARDARDWLWTARHPWGSSAAGLAGAILASAGLEHAEGSCRLEAFEIARRLIGEFAALGVVETSRDGRWTVPESAFGFLGASDHPPMPLQEAHRLLRLTVVSCEDVEADPACPWRVVDLQVFGSVQRGRPFVGDLDVAYGISCKPWLSPEERRRMVAGFSPGRMPWNSGDRLGAAIAERVFGHSPRISPIPMHELEMLCADSHAVWRNGRRVSHEAVMRTRDPDMLARCAAAACFNERLQEMLLQPSWAEGDALEGGVAARLRRLHGIEHPSLRP